MAEIYDTLIVCDSCNVKTRKETINREGFELRAWVCPSCKKHWYHPTDIEDYKRYQILKQRDFEVKLREVGNSWVVSVPKEIIRFEEISATKLVRLNVDEPGKVVLRFTQVKKIYRK
jgi:nitrate reductase beta subunit